MDSEVAESAVQTGINEYLRTLMQSEGTQVVVYTKAYSELRDWHSEMQTERERSWTVCVVYNPRRSSRLEQLLKAQDTQQYCNAIPHSVI